MNPQLFLLHHLSIALSFLSLSTVDATANNRSMGDAPTTSVTPPPTPTVPTQQLRALQLNVWLDATKVQGGLELTASTILDSDADIVSLNEVKNFWGHDFVTNLKEELFRQQQERQQKEERSGQTNSRQKWYGNFPGNPHKLSLDADTAIISRYPVLEEQVVYRTLEHSIVRSLIEPCPNRPPLAVYSVHLEYRAYSCYLPRGYNSHSMNFPGWNPILPRQQQQDLSPSICSSSTATLSYFFWNSLGTLYGLIVGDRTKSSDDLHPVTDVETIHHDNLSSGRPEAISKILQDVENLARNDNPHYQKYSPPGSSITSSIPVIIMGDFNEPSALDWTEATKYAADHNGVVYAWETTHRLLLAGFVDTYRQVYPNPVTHPGYTWPAAAKSNQQQGPDGVVESTGWLKNADERDRIDFIFYKNHPVAATFKTELGDEKASSSSSRKTISSVSLSLHPVDAWLVGTPLMVVGDTVVNESELQSMNPNSHNNDGKETNVDCVSSQDKVSLTAGRPWPSDHRAVMTVFDLHLGVAP